MSNNSFKWTFDRRIMQKVVIDENNCWNWTGHITKNGYGMTSIGNKQYMAHRYTYEWKFGKIKDKLVIDHLCRNRKCVNPDHLEVVTLQENINRGLLGNLKHLRNEAYCKTRTHCALGHELNGKNLYITSRNHKICKKCLKEYQKKYREKAIKDAKLKAGMKA